MSRFPSLLADLSIMPRPEPGTSSGFEVDGVFFLAGGAGLLVVLALGGVIAFLNWRAGRVVRKAREAAKVFDTRAMRRPVGEERVTSSRLFRP